MVDNLEVGGANVDDLDQLLPLPGLDDDLPVNAGELERAARRTIAQLRADKLLNESHALQCQLLLDLCRGYSESVRHARGKVTVAASATAAQIQNLLAALPQADPVPDGGDAFGQLADDLRAAAAQAIREHGSTS